MQEDAFNSLDRFLEAGNREQSLDFLIHHFEGAKEYRLFFEAKLMKARLNFGLPLIQTESLTNRGDNGYEQAMIEAARETGRLALANGDLAQAWPYFRAIGETGPVAEAISVIEPGESVGEIIDIAFREGVHPTKGLELILESHGMCQAITAFGMYAVEKDREGCIGLLVSRLHAEVVERISRAVEYQEGKRPDPASLIELMQGRDWLFGEYDYYVDTSHLHSLLPYSLEVKDPRTLELFHDLCEYGKRLSPMFHSKGQPPFDKPFVDYDEYVLALLGNDVDRRLEHFRNKIAESDPYEVGTAPAQVFVNLAVRLERFDEALAVSMEHLFDEDPANLTCPSVLQLCSSAKNYTLLKDLARKRGDLLSYVAASTSAWAQPA